MEILFGLFPLQKFVIMIVCDGVSFASEYLQPRGSCWLQRRTSFAEGNITYKFWDVPVIIIMLSILLSHP